jgi:hypothetical protein
MLEQAEADKDFDIILLEPDWYKGFDSEDFGGRGAVPPEITGFRELREPE